MTSENKEVPASVEFGTDGASGASGANPHQGPATDTPKTPALSDPPLQGSEAGSQSEPEVPGTGLPVVKKPEPGVTSAHGDLAKDTNPDVLDKPHGASREEKDAQHNPTDEEREAANYPEGVPEGTAANRLRPSPAGPSDHPRHAPLDSRGRDGLKA